MNNGSPLSCGTGVPRSQDGCTAAANSLKPSGNSSHTHMFPSCFRVVRCWGSSPHGSSNLHDLQVLFCIPCLPSSNGRKRTLKCCAGRFLRYVWKWCPQAVCHSLVTLPHVMLWPGSHFLVIILHYGRGTLAFGEQPSVSGAYTVRRSVVGA